MERRLDEWLEDWLVEEMEVDGEVRVTDAM